jgi:hypothetical protein
MYVKFLTINYKLISTNMYTELLKINNNIFELILPIKTIWGWGKVVATHSPTPVLPLDMFWLYIELEYVTLLIDSHAIISLNHSTYKSSRHYLTQSN